MSKEKVKKVVANHFSNIRTPIFSDKEFESYWRKGFKDEWSIVSCFKLNNQIYNR